MKADKQPQHSVPNQMGRIGNRPFWILKLSIVLRALHQVGAAVYLSSFLLDSVVSPPLFYLILAVASGAVLLGAEAMRHRQIYRELSGLSTFVKLILLGLAYHGLLPETATVIIAFIIASIGSHAPKLYRHKLLF